MSHADRGATFSQDIFYKKIVGWWKKFEKYLLLVIALAKGKGAKRLGLLGGGGVVRPKKVWDDDV
jgi:hypothetical protein